MPGNFIVQGRTREGKEIKVFRKTKAAAIKEKLGAERVGAKGVKIFHIISGKRKSN